MIERGWVSQREEVVSRSGRFLGGEGGVGRGYSRKEEGRGEEPVRKRLSRGVDGE